MTHGMCRITSTVKHALKPSSIRYKPSTAALFRVQLRSARMHWTRGTFQLRCKAA